jgi:hypothetical protein
VLVKRYIVPAQNQELVLAVFEEEGWPASIDDPLPFGGTVDRWRRLKSTIHKLNSCQEQAIVRFHGNGTGDGIRWRFVGR